MLDLGCAVASFGALIVALWQFLAGRPAPAAFWMAFAAYARLASVT